MAADGERHVTLSLGLYILGSLDHAGTAAVEQHLPRCRTCRAEYERLAVLPAYLDYLGADDVVGTAQIRGLTSRDPRRPGQPWRCELFRPW